VGTPNEISDASSEEPDPIEIAQDLTQPVDITIPGFQSLKYLYPTSEEHLYTLTGTTSERTFKRLRFARGKDLRARIRLRHELNVLQVLKRANLTTLPQPENVLALPDLSICAVYENNPVVSFQRYLDKITSMDWWPRLGEILRFAHSLGKTLSEVHVAGIFRSEPWPCF
jgi:hypothetical protein